MKISLCVLVFLCALGLTARAALQWETREVSLHPKINDENAVGHFKYKNAGDKPVKITGVKPSCGCTTAALGKDVVAPGESGEITATFHIGDRVGAQTKTIHVTTDEAGDQGTVLTLKADVPQVLIVAPTFLYWAKNQPLTPRTIEAKVGGDFAVTKLKIDSTDKDVEAVAEQVPNEKSFRITVTPKPGNRPINAALKITPDFPKEAPKVFYANVRIDGHPELAPSASPAASPSASPK
ncbi:MAG: DUF1573 domain-containing protein [Chthoniobacterales bacterium]|nr:DUF1573 domain-containing protein [Chthoniobacterales bacterium]